jgi:hypothetical protein
MQRSSESIASLAAALAKAQAELTKSQSGAVQLDWRCRTRPCRPTSRLRGEFGKGKIRNAETLSRCTP